MPLDYPMASSLVRVLRVDPDSGVFADDPDIADPGVALPASLLVADPELTLAWRMTNRTSTSVKIKVTFRKDDGTEVAGTFTAYAFVVVPLCAAEVAMGATRPAIEKQPGVVAGAPSALPLFFDELPVNDAFGLVLTGMSATDATRAFIRAEEVL